MLKYKDNIYLKTKRCKNKNNFMIIIQKNYNKNKIFLN